MRIFYAWLLLVVTLSNWIGGFLYFEVSYYLEVRHEMTALEQSIAAVVQAESGIKSAVKMLSQQPRLKGDVYGDFAFSEEIKGETVFYTLLDSSIQYEKITDSKELPTSSDSNRTLLLKSLLQEFEVTATVHLVSSALTPHQTIFYVASSEEQIFDHVLTPPPNFS